MTIRKKTCVLALGNQKGGCGKSTDSLNLCYSLATTYGKKVLLIDFDSQASASMNLGVAVYDDDVATIDEVLGMLLTKGQHVTWDDIEPIIITPTYLTREKSNERQPNGRNRIVWDDVRKPYGFDLIPSSLNLSLIDMQMAMRGGANGSISTGYLRYIIDIIIENADYDYILIDTPPALSALSMNAIYAAQDGVIIPTNLDVMSMRGIDTFRESTEAVQRMCPHHRGLLAVLLGQYSSRRVVDRELEENSQVFFPTPTFKQQIPESADVKRANANLRLYAQINERAKLAFDNVCREIFFAIDDPEGFQAEWEARKEVQNVKRTILEGFSEEEYNAAVEFGKQMEADGHRIGVPMSFDRNEDGSFSVKYTSGSWYRSTQDGFVSEEE